MASSLNSPDNLETDVSLSPQLLGILACPEDKGSLLYFEDESQLYNPRLQKSYRVDGDIPVMLVDEASEVDAENHERLMNMATELGLKPTFES